MRVRNLVKPDGSGGWGGLALDVDVPARPELRMELASGRRMVLRQGERPLLFARVAADRYGVDHLRAGEIEAPVAPCRAGRARVLAWFGPDEAAARWAHAFAGELAAARHGPLHAGRWTLTRCEAGPRFARLPPAERWLPLADGQGRINWFTSPSARDIVPLRALSAPDAGRVKAYRKQARDGTLPPVLLWWISGLCCHVLLDGHDRLVAALAEGREPAVLVLAARGDEQERDALRGWALDHYAEAMGHAERQVAAGTAHPYTGFVAINRRLGETLGDIEESWGRTRAWPVRVAAWEREAGLADPAWLRRVG